jgi:hypothetical protein
MLSRHCTRVEQLKNVVGGGKTNSILEFHIGPEHLNVPDHHMDKAVKLKEEEKCDSFSQRMT